MDWLGLRDRDFWQKIPVLRLSIKNKKTKAIQFILAMSYRALKFEQFIPNLHPGKIISLSVKHLYTQQRENACSKSMDN